MRSVPCVLALVALSAAQGIFTIFPGSVTLSAPTETAGNSVSAPESSPAATSEPAPASSSAPATTDASTLPTITLSDNSGSQSSAPPSSDTGASDPASLPTITLSNSGSPSSEPASSVATAAPSSTEVSSAAPPASSTAAPPASSTAASSAATAAGALSWAKPSLVSVSASGNGCPQGSIDLSNVKLEQSATYPNRTLVRFNVTEFEVDIGPDTSVSQRTENCQFHLSLAYASGASVAGTGVIDTGYAKLASDVTASFYTTYYFSEDASNTITTTTTITGGGVWAGGSTFTKEDTVPAASAVWSSCGSTSSILNVNVRIALTTSSSTATGTVQLRGNGHSYTTTLELSWEKC